MRTPLLRGFGKCYQPRMTDTSLIRNFSIIAHIDHGKSTLSDRLIQLCGNVSEREMKAQILDSMDIERERGITIKAQTVRLDYKAKDGKTYQLNLMDTPGHVDFAYEVSRSLAACEGAILVVDASQGVEAQTLANVYQAIDSNLEILPVLNKIDLPSADEDRVKQQIEDVIGIDASEAIGVSAKTGLNVAAVLDAIVERLPPPMGDAKKPVKAMLVDSWYDAYLGVIVLVRVIDGTLKKGQRIKMMSTDASYQIERVGIFRVFGRDAGYTSLYTAYVQNIRCCIPEYKVDVGRLIEMLIADKKENPSNYSLVVLSEGAEWEGYKVKEYGEPDAFGHRKKMSVAEDLSSEVMSRTGEETVVSDLTYELRSGAPDFVDSMVAATFGNMAMDTIIDGKSGLMTAISNGCYAMQEIPDPALGPRSVELGAMYDTERYRPNYANKTGIPIFLTRA